MMDNKANDFFLHSNEVNHISKEDYGKIELLVNAAKAFARSTYQCVYIIDYFHQDFIYASDNLAYLCGLQPEQFLEAGYQISSMSCLWRTGWNIPSRMIFISLMVGRADSSIIISLRFSLPMTEEFGLPSAPCHWQQPMSLVTSSYRRMESVRISSIPH